MLLVMLFYNSVMQFQKKCFFCVFFLLFSYIKITKNAKTKKMQFYAEKQQIFFLF